MPKVKKQAPGAEDLASAGAAKKKTTAAAPEVSAAQPKAAEAQAAKPKTTKTTPRKTSAAKAEATPAGESAPTVRKPRTKAAAQEAQVTGKAQAAVEKPSRKRTPKVSEAAPQPVPAVPAAEVTPAEPRRKQAAAKRGRLVRPSDAEPVTEALAQATQEAAEAAAPGKTARATARKAASKAAPTRGRKAAQPEEKAKEEKGEEAAQAAPTQTTTAEPISPITESEPVLLEVPKPGRQRRKKNDPVRAEQTVEAAVEGLAGVEAVPVEAVAPEAGTVTPEAPPVTKVGKTRGTRKAGREKAGAEAARVEPAPTEAAPAEAVTVPNEPERTATESRPAQEDQEPEFAGPSTPEKALITAQLRKLGRPVHVRDLEKTFTRQALERLGGWRRLTDLLEELVDAGQIIRTRKKTYGLPEAMSLVRGRFQASQAGFGFVIPDSAVGAKGGEDYYIPEGRTLEAWNGDIVLVRQEGRGDTRDSRDGGRGGRRGQKGDGNPRASVIRIVQRAYKQLVGTLEFQHGHPILKPDDHRARHRILLLPEGLDGLESGARVVTDLYWPENTGEDEVFGQVARVLGTEDDPETETEAVIVKYGLHGDFPPEVQAQAEAIPVEIPPEALQGRLDLREFNIFTVDGRDAKDFDDAIHIQPTPEGTFVVGIHIADVSHYVREGTPLDTEAYARATSVYLPGRVLPMLPEHLSNGVCSLVPYQDRLTMTALVELSAEGDILKVQLAPSVISSKARLTYDEVQAYSEATATLPEHARHLEGDLHLLLKITTKLRQKRLREGSLDFKLREVKVDVGPDGRMELIPIREETARGMIEDLMLLANKVVAHYLLEREIPTLFRIHEEPTLQRFQEVSGAIGRLGLAFPGGEPTPQAYQAVLKQVRGTGRESVVNTLLLRSMQQAKYAGENLGHFGLAFDEYLHFTSPIRRYPDLVVHRTLRHVLAGDWKAGNREVAQFQAKLPGMGEHTSDRERKAAEAERDLTKYYQCKWAQEHLGESFMGNVSGVVASGLYVALDNGVEGKLHISYLDDDYYVYLEDAQMLKGRRSGRSFRLGDPVNVTIQDVKPLARQIDLVMADPEDPEYKPGSTQTPARDPLQENTIMDQTVKPRARRREEREAEHREKLATVQVSAPRKFTLDDDTPAIQTSPQTPQRQGGYTRSSRGRQGQGAQGQGGRGATFGGVSMSGRGGYGSRDSQSRSGARRVITLERPRNEHLRPVNITVQRMYFGDWTVENMPPEEGQSVARAGRERGYTRQERTERGGNSSGRGWTRGGSDRGAVQHLNGQAQGSQAQGGQSQGSQGGRPQRRGAEQGQGVAAPRAEGAQNAAAGSDEAKRRRRRRGRRPAGNGAPATDSE